jgi:hypothetical protein
MTDRDKMRRSLYVGGNVAFHFDKVHDFSRRESKFLDFILPHPCVQWAFCMAWIYFF